MEYLPNFAIRGLHYDIEKGLLLKLDSFLQIQLGSVYRGLTPVDNAEVIRLYHNRVVPLGKEIIIKRIHSFLFTDFSISFLPLAYVEGASKTQVREMLSFTKNLFIKNLINFLSFKKKIF